MWLLSCFSHLLDWFDQDTLAFARSDIGGLVGLFLGGRREGVVSRDVGVFRRVLVTCAGRTAKYARLNSGGERAAADTTAASDTTENNAVEFFFEQRGVRRRVDGENDHRVAPLHEGSLDHFFFEVCHRRAKELVEQLGCDEVL